MAEPIYKILPGEAWARARAQGTVVPWAPVDRADGFMHLSARHQVRGTAEKHFAGQAGLVILAVDPTRFPEGVLRWEVSRGGDRFPHVYGEVPVGAVVEEAELRWGDGGFVYPMGL